LDFSKARFGGLFFAPLKTRSKTLQRYNPVVARLVAFSKR
jgi:hypothetical protein